uniref:Uncharacterized protein n=1 Tax=Glossina austeni TaxID=7395 RepID=A0A1A9V5H6_GLOAU
MVFIPDALFSEQLQSYPELWGLEKGYICWKVLGRKLADVLTKKTGTLITVEDVRIKLKKVKRSLKRLGNSEGTRYTGMCAYVWYAHKLGLTNAVDKMTSQMFAYGELPVEVDCGEIPVKVDCGEVPVEVDCGEVPVKVDCGEVPVEVDCGEALVEVDCGEVQVDTQTEKPTEELTEDRPFTIESPDRYISSNGYSDNVNKYVHDIYDEGPTTSASAARTMPAMLEIAIKREIIGSAKEIRTYELLAAMTKFNSIFHSGEISSTKWQAQKAVLAEIDSKI